MSRFAPDGTRRRSKFRRPSKFHGATVFLRAYGESVLSPTLQKGRAGEAYLDDLHVEDVSTNWIAGTKDGQLIYFNAQTGKTTTDPPEGVREALGRSVRAKKIAIATTNNNVEKGATTKSKKKSAFPGLGRFGFGGVSTSTRKGQKHVRGGSARVVVPPNRLKAKKKHSKPRKSATMQIRRKSWDAVNPGTRGLPHVQPSMKRQMKNRLERLLTRPRLYSPFQDYQVVKSVYKAHAVDVYLVRKRPERREDMTEEEEMAEVEVDAEETKTGGKGKDVKEKKRVLVLRKPMSMSIHGVLEEELELAQSAVPQAAAAAAGGKEKKEKEKKSDSRDGDKDNKGKGKDKDDLSILKVLHVDRIVDELALRMAVQEMKLLAMLSHPCLPKLRAVYQMVDEARGARLCSVIDYYPGGELLARLSVVKNYCERDIKIVLRRILGALKYLHSLGILHCDVKPENVCLASLTDHTDVRLIDLGSAVVFGKQEDGGGGNSNSSSNSTAAGAGTGGAAGKTARVKRFESSPKYMPPEKWVSPKGDVFSLGALGYSCITGHFIPGKAHDYKVFWRGQGWRACSEECLDALEAMLRKDMDERPSARECLEMPWFQIQHSSSTDPLVRSATDLVVTNEEEHRSRHKAFKGGVHAVRFLRKAAGAASALRRAGRASGAP